jgi:hypothetical protein
MTNTNKQIADLQAQVADQQAQIDKLKASIPTPTPQPTAAVEAAHQDRMREMSERRMSLAHAFSKADLAAFRAAAPDDVCRALARDARAPLNPRSVIPERGSGVRGPAVPPGSGTGWARHVPLKNGLGQGK